MKDSRIVSVLFPGATFGQHSRITWKSTVNSMIPIQRFSARFHAIFQTATMVAPPPSAWDLTLAHVTTVVVPGRSFALCAARAILPSTWWSCLWSLFIPRKRFLIVITASLLHIAWAILNHTWKQCMERCGTRTNATPVSISRTIGSTWACTWGQYTRAKEHSVVTTPAVPSRQITIKLWQFTS